MVGTFGNAGTMPAVRHVGQGVVLFTVGLSGNWTAAKMKIRVSRIAVRPAAGGWGKRDDLLGGGEI